MYKVILENQSHFNINDKDLRKVIKHICENDLTVFIADIESELDFTFANVPRLGVRKYVAQWELYHKFPQDFEETGDAHKHQDEIFKMFGFGLDAVPKPSVADDWKSYADWMQFILQS